jgi:hypothetical protein
VVLSAVAMMMTFTGLLLAVAMLVLVPALGPMPFHLHLAPGANMAMPIAVASGMNDATGRQCEQADTEQTHQKTLH